MKPRVSLKDYLVKSGCELSETTNQWEIARFIANGIICVIYRNQKGQYAFSDKIASRIFHSWSNGKPFKLPNIKRQVVGKILKAQLIRRDGLTCFYSGVEMKEEEATIEHLIPVCRGGKNILENLVLCTEKENQKMGNKSLIQKIKYRDQNRKKEN